MVGARHNNLRDLTVPFPLGTLICVTGPSGSGKSSLVHDILHSHLAHALHRARTVAAEHDRILGVEQLDKVIDIDQSPIGHSPRSDAATYTGLFDLMRKLYALLPESRRRGYTTARFSYNQRGGRCETCWGLGRRRIEMHFLPDVWVECEACGGRRFNPETLEVRYGGRSIAEVLAMSADEALEHFARQPRLRRVLQTLVDVGLGYMQLGQPASTLSGGESQRVRLARELSRPGTGRTLYLLDEPTTGLHVADVQRLLRVLNRLVDDGNTALIIEHNMEVAKAADWVVDLGPGGGDQGGGLVACGPPEAVSACAASATAPFLEAALERSPRVPRSELSLPPAGPPTGEQEEEAAEDQETVAAGDARPPWETDGRAWHTESRLLPDGRSPVWHGEALAWLAERAAALPGMGQIRWNVRDHVTVGAAAGRAAFFLRAGTNEYWWFRVELRTAKGFFDQAELGRELGLKPWNEVPELQVFGRWPRVRVNAREKRWDRITLFLWNRAEVDTPGFARFLARAHAGYGRVAGLSAAAEE